LRIFIIAAALGILTFPQPGHSEEKTRGELDAAGSVKLSPVDQAAQSAAIAKEARDKSEVLERDRDRRMREISKGICIGC